MPEISATPEISRNHAEPVAPPRSRLAPAPTALAEVPPTARRKRILVVDDSSTLRMILRQWLDQPHHDIVEAANGSEALKQLKAAAFDLVTLDVDMPGMDGFAMCAELREWEQLTSRPHTPVMMVTSHDTLADRQRGFEVGATDFLSKPMKESEFLARIDRLLTGDNQLLGLTAIVADDSAVSRRVIAASLARRGIKVIQAENGSEALHLLEADPDKIDLLLTDYDMPVMNGKELCRRVRSSLGLPWLPIIILSGLSDRDCVLELFAAGATDYLCKPFTSEELAARISVHMEIRRLSRERARQVAELERLHELKNSFLAIASHDLRSPLSGILGAATLLLDSTDLSAENRDLAGDIHKSGEWLLQIINDLLDLARIEAQKSEAVFEPLDLTALVGQACSALRHMALPKAITVHESGPADGQPALVSGNLSDLLRLLTNLISNAIKFTPPNGWVEVSTARTPDGQILLTVADAGIGIPAEKLPLLFDRFSKLSRTGTAGELSTGLGMAITKELAERHSGKIAVKSKVGEGTTISITFRAGS